MENMPKPEKSCRRDERTKDRIIVKNAENGKDECDGMAILKRNANVNMNGDGNDE